MVFICRLCGKDDYETSGVDIFSEEGVNKALAYKIKLSLDISVYEYDPLPQYICKICIEKLFTTFAFQESCRRTQIELRERILATESWSLNGHVVDVVSKKQPNSASSEMLQNSTSANAGTPITLHRQPFEFNTFVRNGVLDKLAKVMNSGNPANSKPKNAKKSKQTNNTRRKQQNVNNSLEEPSSIIAPQNNLLSVERLVSNQPSLIQAVQLPQNSLLAPNQASVLQLSKDIVSCSSSTSTHEATNALPFFAQLAPSQQEDNKCESIQIVDVYSVRDPDNTSTTNAMTVNNSSPCISVISGTQAIAIPMMDTSMTSPSYMTPGTSSIPISFIVSPNQPNAGTWHSPTLPNTLGPVTTVPENFQSSTDATPRNWHTPSQTMPESAIQTPTSAEKRYARVNKETSESAVDTTLESGMNSSTESTIPIPSQTTANVASKSRKSITSTTNASSKLSTNASSKSSTNMSSTGTNATSKSSTNMSSTGTNATSKSSTNISNAGKNASSKSPTNTSSTGINASLKPTVNTRRNITSETALQEEDEEEEEEEDIFIVEVVKANKSSIAQHWEKCDEGYKCKDCKKTYKKLVKCENHIRTHLGIRPFECKYCKRRFLKRRLLNEHNISHTGRKLYQCKECPKAFRYRKNFKLHLEVHNEVVSRSYLCEICRKTFKSQYEYWNHKTSKHIIDNSGT